MSRYPKLTIVAATLVFAVASYSKAPASTPPGSTAACKDGSYSTAASKSGACSGHGGVKDWYAGAAAPAVVPAACDAGCGQWQGAGLGEQGKQGLPLPQRQVVRQDEGRRLHE